MLTQQKIDSVAADSPIKNGKAGQRFSVPFTAGAFGIVYANKDKLRAAGLDPATPPRSWEEFVKALETTSARGQGGCRRGSRSPRPASTGSTSRSPSPCSARNGSTRCSPRAPRGGSLESLVSSEVPRYNEVTAASLIIVLPVIALFLLLQRYFVNGLAGAIKG
ncbi:extracellular solute-binding protein [Nonomuraea sp. GTA35]|uniref:extracellular solute-binding protein n=1 Tax=Nonomuraea sp. GTA35 TaxID=1676746 RepID=UPI0035C063D3